MTSEHQNRHVFSASVSILAELNRRLILVKNKNTGKISLPAGGIESRQGVLQAITSEFAEETGLDPLNLFQTVYLGTFVFPGEIKSKIGVVFESVFIGKIPTSSWKVVDEDVSDVLLCSPDDILGFITDNNVHRPDFNEQLLMYWILNHQTEHVKNWAHGLFQLAYPGFGYIRDPLHYPYMTYRPPNLLGPRLYALNEVDENEVSLHNSAKNY